MAGVYPKYKNGPLTYEVNVDVKGGQLVEIDGTTKKVKVATADSRPLGMALTSAAPAGTSEVSTDTWGDTVVDASQHSPHVAVAVHGVVKLENSGAALAWGDWVKAAADGKVTKAAASAGDAALVIGRVMNVDGGATGDLVDVLLVNSPAPAA